MKKQVEIDLKKIFLTPPNTRMEKITLLVMMVVVFVVASANGRSLSLAKSFRYVSPEALPLATICLVRGRFFLVSVPAI